MSLLDKLSSTGFTVVASRKQATDKEKVVREKRTYGGRRPKVKQDFFHITAFNKEIKKLVKRKVQYEGFSANWFPSSIIPTIEHIINEWCEKSVERGIKLRALLTNERYKVVNWRASNNTVAFTIWDKMENHRKIVITYSIDLSNSTSLYINFYFGDKKLFLERFGIGYVEEVAQMIKDEVDKEDDDNSPTDSAYF